MRRPLHKPEIERSLKLCSGAEYWEFADPHYPRGAGYASTVSHHSIAGPLLGATIEMGDTIESVYRVYDFADAVIATARADGRIDLATAMDDALHLGSSAHPFLAVMVPSAGRLGLARSGRVCAD